MSCRLRGGGEERPELRDGGSNGGPLTVGRTGCFSLPYATERPLSCGGRQNAPIPWVATYHSPARRRQAGGGSPSQQRSTRAAHSNGHLCTLQSSETTSVPAQMQNRMGFEGSGAAGPHPAATARTGLGFPRPLPRSLLGCALPEGGARPSPPNPSPSAVSAASPELHAACCAGAPACQKTGLSITTPLFRRIQGLRKWQPGSSELGGVCLAPNLPLPRPLAALGTMALTRRCLLLVTALLVSFASEQAPPGQCSPQRSETAAQHACAGRRLVC